MQFSISFPFLFSSKPPTSHYCLIHLGLLLVERKARRKQLMVEDVNTEYACVDCQVTHVHDGPFPCRGPTFAHVKTLTQGYHPRNFENRSRQLPSTPNPVHRAHPKIQRGKSTSPYPSGPQDSLRLTPKLIMPFTGAFLTLSTLKRHGHPPPCPRGHSSSPEPYFNTGQTLNYIPRGLAFDLEKLSGTLHFIPRKS